ncbi:hypothetical protein [Pseudomonas sp. 43NM1]|uniref:hypothetical protein n=1 Tax=Pseudomonas sp. 43NM1 TaxID=1904755 RepID=UPI0021144594|nr:hypothetical protein [Pseudomonas sp. 43NM1]
MKTDLHITQASTAFLRTAKGVDTRETNSLCCAAAGTIASLSATAEALIPHEKLRGAATPDATLIARDRPPAQPFMGYTHFDSATEPPPQTYQIDKIPEDKMAELVGTTRRALQGKRARGVIPKGVWNTVDNRIYYSIRRYEAWLESQWDCPPELNLQDSPFVFASPGMGNAAARPSPIPKRRRGLRLPPTYALT